MVSEVKDRQTQASFKYNKVRKTKMAVVERIKQVIMQVVVETVKAAVVALNEEIKRQTR